MKKLLSFLTVVCLVGIASVKAQSGSDSAYVRNFTYSFLNVSNLPISIQDTLNSSSPVCKIIKDSNIRMGSWAKGYAIHVTTATSLNIKMLSGGWDCYLYLLDSNYNIVTYNDDYNGSSYGSRMVKLLQPGNYFILAATYNQNLTTVNYSYSLSIQAVNCVDYSGLNYTAKTFRTRFEDTLGSNSQILAEPDDYINANYAKGYTIQVPQCNLKVSINGDYRRFLVLDNNYNSLPYYGDRNTMMVMLPQAGTYHIVVYSTHDYESDASLSDTFAISTDSVSICTYPTLSYRNINLGDTISDSIVDSDAYVLTQSGAMGPLVAKASSVRGIFHAKGYRIQTGANTNYLDINMLANYINHGNVMKLFDANFNEIYSNSYGSSSLGRIYYHVSPSTTYYFVVQVQYFGDTGSYQFCTKATSDIANTYYVDAVNGSDTRNGFTPATAIATIDTALARGEGVARIYLTEDYRFSDDYLYSGDYLEIYPYQKDIRLFVEGTNEYDVFDYGGTIVLGKNGDSLYFLMDSIDGSGIDNFIDYCGYVEINNLKLSNSYFYYNFVGSTDRLLVRNSEFTNNTVEYDELFYAEDIHLVNTTISNNVFPDDGVLSAENFTMEGSHITNNSIRNMLSFFSADSKVNLISGSIRNNMVNDTTMAELAAMLGCSTSNLGGIALLYGATANWGAGFMMDLNSYVLLDSMSTINISENINATAAAQIMPITLDWYRENVTTGYIEGRQVLSGAANILASNYTHFVLAQPASQTWYIHPDGTIHSYSVGIEQAEQTEVALYPNPAGDKVFVQLDGTDADEICVLDIYGKQVKRMAAAEGRQAIDLRGFAKGMYFVQVRNAGTVVATRKLIKR